MAKRSREEFENQNEDQRETEFKRRRVDTKDESISSRLFKNDKDEKQFKSIYEAVYQSDLIHVTNMIKQIIHEIACYATGMVKYCENKDCQRDISALLLINKSIY